MKEVSVSAIQGLIKLPPHVKWSKIIKITQTPKTNMFCSITEKCLLVMCCILSFTPTPTQIINLKPDIFNLFHRKTLADWSKQFKESHETCDRSDCLFFSRRAFFLSSRQKHPLLFYRDCPPRTFCLHPRETGGPVLWFPIDWTIRGLAWAV